MNQRPKITPILPTVYGESLSYLELLGKVVEAINGYNEAFNNGLTDEITAWIQANYNELFFNATYDAERDTLVMSLAESLAAKEGNEPVSYFELAGQVLEIVDKVAREQVETLQQDVKTLRQDVDGTTSAINDISGRFSKSSIDLTSVVIFGDSYVAGSGVSQSDRFANRFQSLANPDLCQIFGYSGLGFSHVSGGVYDASGYFDSIKSQIQDPDNVTCVVVCLGWNDKDRSPSDVSSKAVSFFNKLRAFFTTAKIVYMPTPSLSVLKREVYEAAVQAAWGANCFCLNSSYWLLFDINNFQDDYVHPATYGHKKIALYLYQSLLGIDTPSNCKSITVEIGRSMTVVYTGDSTNVYISYNKSGTTQVETIGQWPSWMFLGNNSGKPRANYFSPAFAMGKSLDKLGFVYWENTGLDIKCNSLTPIGGSGFSSGTIVLFATFNTKALFG